MSFWNEAFYFEKRGDRYVYRHSAFEKGYDISESEKDLLFSGLCRLQWRSLCEGAILIALIALPLMTGVIKTAAPIPWFMISSVLAVAVLALTVFVRRDALVVRVLGDRAPEVPRLAPKQALTRARPMVGKRFALPVLKSVLVLFGLTWAAGDAVIAYLIFAGYRARETAQSPQHAAAAADFIALTAENMQFWAAVAAFNAVMVAVILLLVVQLRTLRAAPEDD